MPAPERRPYVPPRCLSRFLPLGCNGDAVARAAPRAFRRMVSDSAKVPLAEPAGTGYSRGLAGRRGHPEDLPGRVAQRESTTLTW